jgi:hypothetical protein
MNYAIKWRDDASGFVGPHAGKLASTAPHFESEGEAETVRLGMPNAEHAEVILVADEVTKDWELDEASRERTAAALAAIDAAHDNLPTCVVCGQRSTRLDKQGTCSKTSEPHREHRNEMKASVRA